jgi:outer membrane murein-binding lipoprotein Lpp
MARNRKNRNRSKSNNTEAAPASAPAAEIMVEENNPLSESSIWPADGAHSSAAPVDHRVASAIDTNKELLEQIQAQLTQMCEGMASHVSQSESSDGVDSAELQSLRDKVLDLEAQVGELEKQNDELTARVTSASMQAAVASTEATHETLSWAERKQLMLDQMEAETFDAEEFVTSLDNESSVDADHVENPAEFVNRLSNELARREEEVHELQHLLKQQSETREEGVSIGAAGIAEMLDSDELVREERARLQELQDQWEEKFRQAEIEASLERAKLSRERRELAAKQSKLEAELESARLQSQRENEKGAPRKWLSQLGLAGS